MKFSKAFLTKVADGATYTGYLREVATTFLNIVNRVIYEYGPWKEVNFDCRITSAEGGTKTYTLTHSILSEKDDVLIKLYWSKNFENPNAMWGGKPWFQANVFDSPRGQDMLDEEFLFMVKHQNLNDLVSILNRSLKDIDGFNDSDDGGGDSPEPTSPVPTEDLQLINAKNSGKIN